MFERGAGGAGEVEGGDGLPCASPLLTEPAVALGCVARALGSSGLSCSLEQARQAYLEATTLVNAGEALRLHAVRVMDAHEGEAAGVFYPGSVSARWLAENACMTSGRARALVQAARTGDPEADPATGNGGKGALPKMGAALAAGQVTREHLEIAVRALGHLPTGMVRQHAEAIDALFTEHARHLPPSDASQLATAMVATLAPNNVEDFADRAHDRRWLRVRTDRTGMVRIEGQLDPVGGALFKTLIEHLASLARTAAAETAAGEGIQGHGIQGHDDDTDAGAAEGAAGSGGSADGDAGVRPDLGPDQYLADAAVELTRYAQVGLGVEHPHAEPTRVSVILTPEQMTHPHPHDDTDTDTDTDADGDADAEGSAAGDPAAQTRAPAAADAATLEPAAEAAEGAPAEDESPAAQPAAAGPAAAPEPASSSAEPVVGEPVGGEAVVASAVPGWCRAPGPARCEATGVLSARAVGTLVCDAVLDRVVISRAGTVVSLTSLGRLATRAQRRALAARDGGCTWPGCSAKASWSDAHHVTWWSRGGATVLENLCLLCQHHHTEIHREQWTIVMIQGVPWFRPPPWIDPDQRLRRNSRHTTLAQTITAAQRLAAGQPITDLLTKVGPWTARDDPEPDTQDTPGAAGGPDRSRGPAGRPGAAPGDPPDQGDRAA